MFIWQAALAILAAIGLIKLGALAVWVSVLTLSVKILTALIAMGIVGIIGYVVWRKYGNHHAAAKGLTESKQ